MYQWHGKSLDQAKSLLMASLYRFPDTKEIREELWHLQQNLANIWLSVEFLGEKGTLGVCRMYYGGHLYPGIALKKNSQQVRRETVEPVALFTPQYFSSELEYAEYKRLDQLVMSYWIAAMKKWEQEGGKEGGLTGDGMSTEILDATKKKNEIAAQARERWYKNHPPLLRIERPAPLGGIIAPVMLVVHERYTVPISRFAISEHTLNRLRKTTARLVLEARPRDESSILWATSRARCEETALSK